MAHDSERRWPYGPLVASGPVDDDPTGSLAETYLVVLRLLAEGRSRAEMSEVLGVPDASVTPLVRLAAAKALRMATGGTCLDPTEAPQQGMKTDGPSTS